MCEIIDISDARGRSNRNQDYLRIRWGAPEAAPVYASDAEARPIIGELVDRVSALDAEIRRLQYQRRPLVARCRSIIQHQVNGEPLSLGGPAS